MPQLFANNASTRLAVNINNVSLSLTVTTGDGAKFPNPTGGDFFLVTLSKFAGGVETDVEIVKVTARSGDSFTIVRGQEGTTGLNYVIGDFLQLRTTAATYSAIDTHILSVANPHSVTKTQVGLGNVDNTTDAGKPISTATQTALDLKASLANPTFTGTVGGVTKSMVGLANVDNTSDANKPVSTAQATANSLVASNAASDATTKANAAAAASAPVAHVGSGGTAHANVVAAGAAGFMTGADKTKLDGIQAGAIAYVHPTNDGNLHVLATGTTNDGRVLTAGPTAGSLSWTVPTPLASTAPANLAGTAAVGVGTSSARADHVHAFPTAANVGAAPSSHVGTGGAEHPNVVAAGASGFMTGADKTKLDGIAAGATNYSLPIAAAGTLGGIRVGSGLAIDGSGILSSSGATNIGQGTNTTTAVLLTSSTGTGTTIGAATGIVAGVMASADKTKLDGIATGATANTGTVTSVAALTLGSTGTDISSTVATGTTTPVITLNVPTASAANRGLLSAADWSTFNGKQAAGAYLTGNQSITFSGGATGSGTTAVTLTLSNTAVTGQAITGFLSGSGTVAATDSILGAINKLDGNIGLKANLISPTFTTPNIGVASGTSFNSITGLSSTTPVVAGVAAVGVGITAARGDHVHPAQTTVTGNAGTVTNATLTTALTVNTGTVTLTGNVANTSALTLGAGASSVSGSNTGDNAVNTLYSGLVTNATHTGDVTGSGALTIAAGAVTYAKMQNVSVTSRVLGRITAGAGVVEELTGANLATIIGITNTAANVTSVNGNTGAVTAAQISAAATTGYGYTPLNPAGNAASATTAASCSGNTAGSAATFTSTSQNSQFNSIGVGTPASAVAGEIRATNNVTAYYSDDRLKTRLGNIESALEKVETLDAFYYEANDVAQALGYTPIREVGISAQQVQVIMPEVVAPAPIDDKYLTVRYERLVPLLIQAIKELNAEVKMLKGL